MKRRRKDSKKIPDDKRMTTPHMTKYERVRVLSIRATQISWQAPLFIQSEGVSDPLQIALRELELRRIPLVIRRVYPDGW